MAMKIQCSWARSRFLRALGWAALLVALGGASSQGAEVTATYQVTGLFCQGRAADLRVAVGDIPGVALVGIDYGTAEATFRFDPKEAFPGIKPDEVVKHLDNKVRSASGHTFGVRPRREVAREKLRLVEIAVAGCDCKACSLAAYEAVYQLPGVEQATASFRDGRVTALIDPLKTDRAKLKAALEKRGVTVRD
jgi:copper chaperone CopZ